MIFFSNSYYHSTPYYSIKNHPKNNCSENDDNERPNEMQILSFLPEEERKRLAMDPGVIKAIRGKYPTRK